MSRVKNNFWREIKRPIAVLAPMAGYTDSAFRLMCKKFGCDVVITELISADAIAYAKIKNQKSKIKIKEDFYIFNRVSAKKNNATAELLSFFEAERPLVVQLFGKNPENFAKAARWITENLKPDGIDINMGCPARKVVGSDHGAALLKNPKLACEIIRAVKENTCLPVSVKTRLGWNNDDEILKFAPLLLDAGIDAIIIHGRTYKDGFSGEARWENIYKLKEIMGDRLIVIGNGDLQEIPNNKFQISNKNLNSKIPKSVASYQLPATDCQLDGYAIGRATFGKPWIFGKNTDNSIQITDLKETILEHAKLAYETKSRKGIIEFRKHLLAYLKGFNNAKKLRMEAVKIESIDEIASILKKLER